MRRTVVGFTGLALATLAPGAGAAKLAGWNVSVASFTSHAEVPDVANGIWVNEQTETTLFQVGSGVVLVCPWKYTTIGPVKNFEPFDVGIFSTQGANGPVAKLDVKKFDPKGPKGGLVHTLWVPKLPGKFQLHCRSSAVDENPQDNERKLFVLVVPKNGSGSDGSFPAPTPVIEAPKQNALFALEPGARLYLGVTLPDHPFGNAKNIAAYAMATPYEERWHIDVVRRGTGALSAFEDEVAAFAGPLTSLEIGAVAGKQLTTTWFEQHGGPGAYRIRAYLTQQVDSGTRTGPKVSVDFDVTPPAKTLRIPKPGDSPAMAGGVVVPPPPASDTRAPGAVKKPGTVNEVAAPGLILPLPDLAAEKQKYQIAGVIPGWDNNTSVDEQAAVRAENGHCFFKMKLHVRNAGAMASGPFMAALRADEADSGAVMQWRSIAPRATATVEQLVELQAGDNHLSFTIDPHFALKEADESNNKQTMRILVKGKCLKTQRRSPT
jgi:hypothetical protein